MAITIKPAPQPASRAVPASKASKPGFDKKAYQRELMRKRREGMASVDLPADLVADWKATGPDWKERMAEALTKSL